MELICSRCDGLGEERRKLYSPEELFAAGSEFTRHYMGSNCAGWDLQYGKDYMRRRCEVCDGTGFRPSGASVPSVPGPDLPDFPAHPSTNQGERK